MQYISPPSYTKPVSLEMESHWAETILTMHENARVNLNYPNERPTYDFSLRSANAVALADVEKNHISINRILAELNHTEEFVSASVANEIAHLINQERYGDLESFISWGKIVRSLGETPNKTRYKAAGHNNHGHGVMPFVSIKQ
ncbi:putative SprT family Zn-dependent metalloprotease [Litorivivens lipolytica]|uniref:Putative SprT family Zn-dependent metalloprotease n=1 Tax=Litorivivens lipolytica TaxID=1524264 RepID=A0A7W4W3X8_9GAMM|nr:hypothetical protein [Litorivivens lipolytica]MBB3047002.1 putative SprT family Zn-dependent metalloprotease [Litorivivens lipolytica]